MGMRVACGLSHPQSAARDDVADARARGAGAAGEGLVAQSPWQRRCTDEVPRAERFEFWQQFPAGSHMERPLGDGRDFFGEFAYTATPDGILFGAFTIDPCASRFGDEAEPGFVDIGMVKAGTMHIRYGQGQALVLKPGAGPTVFDPAQPLTTRTSRCDLAYLRLPRAAVEAALGAPAIPVGAAVRPLPVGAITAQLGACLQELRPDARDTLAVVNDRLHAARALALVALAASRGPGHHWPGALDTALYRAACCLLARNMADPRTTAEAISATLHCSRAQLYRVFAARGESVAGRLRELRMQRAAELLSGHPGSPVGAIAPRCGYSDPIGFDKAFRRRFGMTPTAWRRTHGADRATSARIPDPRHGS